MTSPHAWKRGNVGSGTPTGRSWNRSCCARTAVRTSAVVIVLLLAWAALAPVDEVTRGEARVVPSRQLQVVQSVDGGVVEALMVKEGQEVQAGQLLLRVDPTRFRSSMLESRAAHLALQAKASRLEALTRGEPFKPSAELLREVPDIAAQERRLYESRLDGMRAQTSISQNQLAQRVQELNEVRARRQQADVRSSSRCGSSRPRGP